MPAHDYTEDLSDDTFTIKISPSTLYGYFEHDKFGEDVGGGLWFVINEGRKELYDYDGVYELPRRVAEALRAAGYHLDESFDPDPVH